MNTPASDVYADAIERCWKCHGMCLALLLESAGSSAPTDLCLAHALVDGFELSRASAHALGRRSRLTSAICGVCAHAARRVADACDRTCDLTELVTRCADASYACAGACELAADHSQSESDEERPRAGADRVDSIH